VSGEISNIVAYHRRIVARQSGRRAAARDGDMTLGGVAAAAACVIDNDNILAYDRQTITARGSPPHLFVCIFSPHLRAISCHGGEQ